MSVVRSQNCCPDFLELRNDSNQKSGKKYNPINNIILSYLVEGDTLQDFYQITKKISDLQCVVHGIKATINCNPIEMKIYLLKDLLSESITLNDIPKTFIGCWRRVMALYWSYNLLQLTDCTQVPSSLHEKQQNASDHSQSMRFFPPFVALRLSKKPIESIPESIPKEIGNLKSLTHLDISHNGLQSIPKEIGNLKSLSCLDIVYNKLQCIPTIISDLKSLKNIDITNNKLKSIPKEIND